MSDSPISIDNIANKAGLARRDVIKGMALLGIIPAALTNCTPADVDEIVDSRITIANRPVRRKLNDLSPNSDIIVALRDAVATMQGLPDTDTRSWAYQANIHQNWCPHGNWLFLPWHRHYLFWFEQIVRNLTGMNDFALPYWNWIEDREIPTPFQSGVLNDTSRRRNHVRNGIWVNPCNENQMDEVMAATVFAPDFGSGALNDAEPESQHELVTKSRFELRPHDFVHYRIDGNLGEVANAALDPIFWCHHSMIDYLWTEWNLAQGNPNPAEEIWKGFSFDNNFVSGSGSPLANSVVTQVRYCLLFPLLSYQYEDSMVGSVMGTTSTAIP